MVLEQLAFIILTIDPIPNDSSAPPWHLIDIQSYIFLLNSNIIFN